MLLPKIMEILAKDKTRDYRLVVAGAGPQAEWLEKEAEKLRGFIKSQEAKLANQGFMAKAPAAVLEQEKKRLADFTATLAKVREQLARL